MPCLILRFPRRRLFVGNDDAMIASGLLSNAWKSASSLHQQPRARRRKENRMFIFIKRLHRVVLPFSCLVFSLNIPMKKERKTRQKHAIVMKEQQKGAESKSPNIRAALASVYQNDNGKLKPFFAFVHRRAAKRRRVSIIIILIQ